MKLWSRLAVRNHLFALLVSAVSATGNGAWTVRWAPSLLRSELKEIESELANVERRLSELPEAGSANSSGSLGLHSTSFTNADERFEVLLDLQSVYSVDAIALVPARAWIGNNAAHGYGFPVRFRLEIARTADFKDARVVADETARDLPPPRMYPYVADFAPAEARFVRLTVSRHWQRGPKLWVTALGEMIVLSGPRNVALRKTIIVNGARRSIRWNPEYLVDGITPMGIPGNTNVSESNGYHSAIASTANQPKWVQVDLGASLPVEEVRIIPTYPLDWIDTGFGFPLRFRVDLSARADLADAVTVFDSGSRPYPSPGINPVVIDVGGRPGRFVRVTAVELYASAADRYVFALAELQVMSGGRYVSTGCPVSAKDSFEFPGRPLWATAFLTDGYSSERELLPVNVWIRQLAERSRLETARQSLQARRQREIGRSVERMKWLLGTFAMAGLLAAVGIWFWGWRARQRELQSIRSRIARDLHDEVGSNLAAVIHLSGALESETADPQVSAELSHIRQVARETSDALRDMVWMLHHSNSSVSDLAGQMEDIAKRTLKGRNVKVRFVHEDGPAQVQLEVRRNVLLAFREVLSNVIQHSGAQNVKVDMQTANGRIRFRVEDDGSGFDTMVSSVGWGLRNLQRRADAVNGEVRVKSAAGVGSVVEFEVPLR